MHSPLKLIARIEQYGEAGYMAYIETMKGMVEMAKSPEEAMKELIISLKVKLAYDLNIDLGHLKDQALSPFSYRINRIDLNRDGFAEKEIFLDTVVC